MTEIEARVSAGAKWLDGNRPGWQDEINPDRLDMDNEEECIIGQLYGHFSSLPEVWIGAFEAEPRPWAWLRGFDRVNDDPPSDYADLRDAWLNEIEARRGALAIV